MSSPDWRLETQTKYAKTQVLGFQAPGSEKSPKMREKERKRKKSSTRFFFFQRVVCSLYNPILISDYV